ncbi:MAG: class I SAM-dependent methyltransferase [Filomicrobium sp.]
MTNDLDSVFSSLKAKQQNAWASGDYAIVGTTLQIVGEQLCETIDLRAGTKVLDVAAGNGNATLAAARRFCEVTSTDYVPALLDKARGRAKAEGVAVVFQTADAEDLPFEDNSFDVVLSTFGVMFTPNQPKAAAEMMRVVRPGGKIALANWTPESFIGQIFKTIGRYLPPPAGVQSPALWGTEARLEEFYANAAKSISLAPRSFMFRYRTADHFMDVFRTYYGPIHKAFQALDSEGKRGLDADLRNLIDDLNVATDGTLVVPASYVEAVIIKA